MSKLSSGTLVIGTRRSRLALWQTHYVKELLEKAFQGLVIEVKEIITRGDTTQAAGIPLPAIGGKGLFTAELEDALRREEIHIAVHSLKDLPTEMEEVFTLGAICERESVYELLFSRDWLKFMELPAGAVVGTSSLRRSAQLRRLRGDLRFESIRGNVDTRIAKVHDPAGRYYATVLAEAGVRRLERDGEATQRFSVDEILPAPGQGALAVQCLSADDRTASYLKALDSVEARAETTAERAFLRTLQAGCSTPVAALARFSSGRLTFKGRCLSHDGKECIEVVGEDDYRNADQLGARMAGIARERGFDDPYGMTLSTRNAGCARRPPLRMGGSLLTAHITPLT